MDFFKNLFGKKREQPAYNQMPPEILEMITGHRRGIRTPVFMLKDHPTVEQFLKANRERRTFVEKQMEGLREQDRIEHEKMWSAIEGYMLANGLWPKGVPVDKNQCWQVSDGVVQHHRHE